MLKIICSLIFIIVMVRSIFKQKEKSREINLSYLNMLKLRSENIDYGDKENALCILAQIKLFKATVTGIERERADWIEAYVTGRLSVMK